MNTLEKFCVLEAPLREIARSAWEQAGFTSVRTSVRLFQVDREVRVGASGFFPGAETSFERGSFGVRLSLDGLEGGFARVREMILEAGQKLIKERQSA